MKKHLIMTTIVLAALTLTSCGNQAQEQTEAPKETAAEAPTADTTFREFNVVADYQGNPFSPSSKGTVPCWPWATRPTTTP